MIGGDGNIVSGGCNQQHSSTQAAEKLWRQVFPDTLEIVEWDQFHRADRAFAQVLKQHSFAQEVMAMGRAMNQQFGCGTGRVLLRSVAAELGEQVHSVDDCGGTRKVFALSKIGENILANLRYYTASLHLKMHLKRAGHGSNSQTALSAIGRRLTSLDFVVFTCLFADIMKTRVQPFALTVQSGVLEPWETSAAFHKFLRNLEEDMAHLANLRKMIFATTLLQHYLGQRDLAKFWYTQLYTEHGKRFRITCRSMFGLLVQRTFDNTKLQVQADLRPGNMCLTPRCQCAARAARGENKKVRVRMMWGGRARFFKVPEYVARSSMNAESVRQDQTLWKESQMNIMPSASFS
jgi:hypothetical protein